MRLTQQANYSVRILMYCAANDGRYSKVSDIAKIYAISEYHLFKILPVLVEGGLIETLRGRNGGVRLAHKAEDIYLGEVIKTAEENFHLAACFDTGSYDCPLLSNCKFNRALGEALSAFFDALNAYTIADLTQDQPGVRSLLNIDFGDFAVAPVANSTQ
ncbi:MAG: iron-responsive transcriptional regulator RirA [Cohaesibacteraceae bacterium]|nr:iron-responsive transcriptional regulator RirA [Cohaesibacteraceae bacterium]